MSVNPVLSRELRERVRNGRSFAVLTVFLLLLTGLVWLVFTIQRSDADDGFGGVDLAKLSGTGRVLYDSTVIGLLVLLVLFLPAIASGAIAGERERQTLVPLQVTLLRPRSILWGKVTSSIAFVALLLVAALPLFAVSFQLGGLTLLDAMRGVIALLLAAAVITTIAVSCSALVRRVQGATVLAYLAVIALVVTSPIAIAVAAAIDASRGSDGTNPPTSILLPNPVVAVAYLSGGNLLDGASDRQPGDSLSTDQGILRAIREALSGSDRWDERAQVNEFVDTSSVSGVPNGIVSIVGIVLPAVALFVLGTRKLRTPAETER
jgi:ABC-type transport system involved in multi-copper enzyme maturation permease subunit